MTVLVAGCGASSTPSGDSPSARCCPVVELRQYTLHPGQRDVLIDLFDREFVETQEATGMTIIGQFRDLDDPDRFVWFRGFSDMPSRAEALKSFYGGPVWKAHREAANATMIDSDNVLLLRPARPESGFALGGRTRRGGRTDVIVATIYSFDTPVGDDFIDFFVREVGPLVTGAGASIEGTFVTERSPNTFPALPVREGEDVFVWVARFPDRSARDRHAAALAGSARWREVSQSLERRLSAPPHTLLLSPTTRSLL